MQPFTFRPPRALGVIVAGALAGWAALFATLLVILAWGSEPEVKTFVAWIAAGAALVAACLFGYWAYAVSSLSYVVDTDGLTIRWGLRVIVIPIEDIQRMAPGRTVERVHVRGLNWWGCHVGRANVERFGETRMYSTHSAAGDLLYVVTPQGTYGLTVLDHAHFAEAVQRRALPGPVQARGQHSRAIGPAALPIWRDDVARIALGFAFAACLVMIGYSFTQYPGLPDVIQFDYPESGGIVRIGDKSELLRIPLFGVILLGVNAAVGIAVHHRERAASIWLFGAAGIMQVVLLAATVLAYNAA